MSDTSTTTLATEPSMSPSPAAARVASPLRTLPTLAIGLFGGAALGVVARAWMRLIATEPEFTWAGTIFIVAAFTIFGLTQSIVAAVRRASNAGWKINVTRVLGAIGLMPLFIGAGAIMLPTVICGGLAVARVRWERGLRAILAVIAIGPVVLVARDLIVDLGFSMHALIGFVAFLVIYGTIVVATRFTFSAQTHSWKLNRWVRIAIIVVVALLQLQMIVGIATA